MADPKEVRMVNAPMLMYLAKPSAEEQHRGTTQ